MSLTIEVPENRDEVGHFLVQFSNGCLQPSAKQPRFTLYHKSSDKTKKRKIVVAETGQLTYVGTNYDADSITSGTNMCKYCVGAVDRESGTLTLHKAELFTLKPYIPGKTDTDISEISPSKLDRVEAAQKMVSSFGSERQKRAYAAAQRNRVEASALETALATAVTHAQTEVDKAAVLDSQSLQSSGLMPAHNPRAESPQDVYDLMDIVSLEELKILKKTAKTIAKATTEDVKQWRENQGHPEYVLSHISLLPSMEPQRTLKAALLLYASFLIKMYNLHPKAMEKHGLSSLDPPALVKDQLLSKFAEGQGEGSFVLTPRMKAKILSHLFVLALIIDDFSVDCTALQRDLRITTTKLTDNFRALGCTVEKSSVKRKLDTDTPLSSSSCTALLKIPLNFPRVKKTKKR